MVWWRVVDRKERKDEGVRMVAEVVRSNMVTGEKVVLLVECCERKRRLACGRDLRLAWVIGSSDVVTVFGFSDTIVGGRWLVAVRRCQ